MSLNGLNGGYCYRERLGAAASGRSALSYLSEKYPHSSEDEWRRRIEIGLVRVEDRPVSTTRRLRAGEILAWDRPPWREPQAPSSFALLYRDDDLLGVGKPAGLPTMPGGGFLENTLLRKVRRFAPGAAPLHRLGRGTSGVVLFARNREAMRALSLAWKSGRVERRYRALVTGSFPPGESVIDEPIGRVAHPVLGSVAAIDPKGKPARSRVSLLEHRGEASLVEIEIETGRTHQIRIHLAAFGHPLVSDPLYPPGGIPSPDARALPGEIGYPLHAFRIRFPHPRTGATVTVECGPPELYRARTE